MRPIVSAVKSAFSSKKNEKTEEVEKKEQEKVKADPYRAMFEQSPVKSDAQKLDEEVKLEIKAVKVAQDQSHTDVLISIVPPQGEKRCPQDVVCIVDISGSMGDAATMTATDGTVESHGMCLLDIVGHAVRTVAAALDEEDRMALVLFDDRTETPFELQKMNEGAKKKLVDEVGKLRPRGGTLVWGGLEAGLDILKKAKELPGRRNNSLILLTDGETSGDPYSSLKQYQSKNEGKLPGTLMTFGFGYNMNSTLLDNLSQLGGGMYCFIPDASIVGTAFVNCVSNLQSTFANQVVLSLETHGDVKVLPTQVGSITKQDTQWGVQFDLSTLQYGQSKDVVVRLSGVPDTVTESYLSVGLTYINGEKSTSVHAEATESPSSANEEVVLEQRFRLQSVDVIRTKNEKERADLVSQIQSSKAANRPHVQELLKDLEGQVKEATANANYMQKWGRHFLPSIAKAHQSQQCNNFKDPGVQVYGGEMFNKIRDHLDDIFIQLPPPTPTLNSYSYGSYGGRGSTYSASAAPINMGNYYNACGGCFHGNSKALMADESLKKVSEVRKGDHVINGSGNSTAVRCVLKTVYPTKKTLLVTLGDLKLTPYHPVKPQNGEWTFPKDLNSTQVEDCEAVFSFLLEEGSSMIIEGVECVSLAHGLKDNSVVSHDFFGTEKIVEDMKNLKGFEEGLVSVFPHNFVRDENNFAVVGLTQDSSILAVVQQSLPAFVQVSC